MQWATSELKHCGWTRLGFYLLTFQWALCWCINLSSQLSLAFWEKFHIVISAGEGEMEKSLFTRPHLLHITIILDLIGHFSLLFFGFSIAVAGLITSIVQIWLIWSNSIWKNWHCSTRSQEAASGGRVGGKWRLRHYLLLQTHQCTVGQSE